MADELPVYRRILHPTDGSACSRIASRHAAYLARALGAEVTVLYVVDVDYHAGIHLGEEAHELIEEAHEVTADAAHIAEAAEVTVHRSVVRGDPARAIVAVAKRDGCDLVIMGAKGEGFLERVLLGSVSTHVVEHAHCPVLVIRD